MKTPEEALKDIKNEFEGMEAPPEMEARLMQALQGRKRRRTAYKPVAAVVIAALLITYSFDALAYYGKKFIGYDQMDMGSLKQLNDEGRGQEIGKSCTFSNGVKVTVDGIMFDDNELAVFYKMLSPDGKVRDMNLPQLRVYGIKPWGYFNKGGEGTIIDDSTMTFIDILQPPGFYEKWMRFEVELNVGNIIETHTINFILDRNSAMKRTAKLDLNAEVKLGDYKILFDRLTASTMSSLLEGRVVPLTEEALKAFEPEGPEASLEIPEIRFDIISDGGEVKQFTAGQGVSGNRISFTASGDPLPEVFKTLQIRNIRLETLKLVDKTVDLAPDTKNLKLADDLTINRVYQDGDGVCVAVSSRGIPVMGLFDGDRQLEQSDPQAFDLEAESAAPVERIYKFKGAGESLKLSVKFIRYSKFSPDVINIPAG